jgi:hypothetical protein
MQQLSSSPGSLSSPPSALSEPGSPTRYLNAGRANIEMDEIVVDPGSVSARFGVIPQPVAPPQAEVRLTAAGLPRKKPGRKPGSTVKPKAPTDGSSTNTEPPKQRRPRKPRDPNAPPIQRKRKSAAVDDVPEPMQIDSTPPVTSSTGPRQTKITELTSMRMSLDSPPPPPPTSSRMSDAAPAPKVPKRESMPSSMQSILNDDPPPKPQPSTTTSTSTTTTTRQIFDPVRGNYDPVRETMVTRDPYGTGPLGSPRAPSQAVNRASASPSIASLVDPTPTNMMSPVLSNTTYNNTSVQSRYQEPSTSMPPSPSHPPARAAAQHLSKPAITEIKRPPPPPAPAPVKSESAKKPDAPPKPASFTATTPSTASATTGSQAPVHSKKVTAMVQKERESNKKASSTSSSPKISGVRDSLTGIPPVPDRSILDFGKANPGEEMDAPSILLHIPLNGETNKYVNFMRMAEERYGWDALNPRLAAKRERKARIAAASAALEKTGSGRDSGDEIEEDLHSDAENSNVEMGGMGNGTSGPDAAPAKPVRKKRNFKEDEYDRDDDFVDDSEMLWEQQAAASRDGFFVYSGPLVQEAEKTAVPEGAPKRGRGGRGSRGGARGAAATRGEGAGRGRGGGPGSRGGQVTRKPRITKLEKEQRDREKAEREKMAQMTSKSGSAGGTSTPLDAPHASPNPVS